MKKNNIQQWCDLSYSLDSRRKFYKDSKILITRKEKYSNNLVNRETEIFINSHMGTHIDFPAHCIQNGNFG
ncbi:TPA: cyclase family protein, partial [Campylobacter jejuni]|nr:cyclase family protein [Campylobacter jejuni]